MRLVVQRVTEAAVHIGGVCAGRTGRGLMILIGIEEADTEEDALWLAKKAADMRIFSDEEGKMNLSEGHRGRSPGRQPVYAARFHQKGEQALLHPRRETRSCRSPL